MVPFLHLEACIESPASPSLVDRSKLLLPCQSDPDAWFSDDPTEIEAAKAACLGCPLAQYNACRADGWHNEFGVFGGLSAADRRELDAQAVHATAEERKRAARAESWAARNSTLVRMTGEGMTSRAIGDTIGKSNEAVRMLQRKGRSLGVLAGTGVAA